MDKLHRQKIEEDKFMTEYGVCPECDSELNQTKNDEYKTILQQCPLCSFEDVIPLRQPGT